jgi:hypothetical protein
MMRFKTVFFVQVYHPLNLIYLQTFSLCFPVLKRSIAVTLFTTNGFSQLAIFLWMKDGDDMPLHTSFLFHC